MSVGVIIVRPAERGPAYSCTATQRPMETAARSTALGLQGPSLKKDCAGRSGRHLDCLSPVLSTDSFRLGLRLLSRKGSCDDISHLCLKKMTL
jgi:hypothetical protein